MKILHVIANLAPRYGGPSKACVEMACASTRLGHEVSIYTTNQDGPGVLPVPTDRAVDREGVRIRFFPVQRPKRWVASFPLAKALREKIRNVDIVHIHTLYLFHTLAAASFCRRYDVPYVLRPHGCLVPYIYNHHRFRKRAAEFLFQDRVTRNASGIHYITEQERALSQGYAFGVPGFVVPIGLDAAEYAPPPRPGTLFSRFQELDGKKILLFLGRIDPVKGLDILAEAFSAVARERGDVHLLLAGPDDNGYGEKVAGWLKKGGALSKTTFTGPLHGMEKLEAFHNSSLFVLPSYSENFGISALEAMACGLPVIVSDKVNLWPAVVEAQAGEVAPCDAKEVARKILKCLDDDASSRRMGRNGQVLVRERYSWNEIGKTLISEYNSIIEKHNGFRQP